MSLEVDLYLRQMVEHIVIYVFFHGCLHCLSQLTLSLLDTDFPPANE